MEAIIIAGMPAAGKTTIAKIIAQRLHIKELGGGDVLKEMAIRRGYKAGGPEWWDTREGIRFLRERATNPDFDKEADRIMVKRIEEGDVVVTSYTAAWISKRGFKVWLEGSEGTRAERMVSRDNTEMPETLEVVRLRDRENYDVYKRMYNIELGKDKKPFDMIVDTNAKAPKEIAEIIIKEFKKRNKM